MRHLSLTAAACAVLLAACKGDTKSGAQRAPIAGAASSPQLVFYVPPLVESASRSRMTPTTEWSQNDDRDSLIVVVRGVLRGRVMLAVDAFVRRVSLADEAKNVVPRDTIGRRVQWQR